MIGIDSGRRFPVLLGAVVCVFLALAAPFAAAPVTAAQRPDLLPDCVYGTSGRGLSGFESRVQHDAWAYADRHGGRTSHSRLAAARAYAASEVAYVWGLPLVKLHDTVRKFRFRNTIVSVAKLADPQSRSVVSPNVDTAYTVGWLSLTQGPVVIDVPDTHGRYYTFQLMDAYTNSFAYLGSGSTGTHAGSYALVPPGWSGTLPAGVRKIQSPTRTIWLLGRTLVDGPDHVEEVKPILQAYRATPLSAWQLGVRSPSLVLDQQPPQPTTTVPTGTDFIATLNQELTIDPPPWTQNCVLRALAPAGVEQPDPSAAAVQAADTANGTQNPTGSTAATATNLAVAAGTRGAVSLVRHAATRFARVTSAGKHGWSVLTDAWIGDFGRTYLGRAIVATDLIGANIRRVAVYPTSYADSTGHPLNGLHRYTITFRPGQLPPVRAFWSLTMYRPDNFLYANPINRYALGDRDRTLRFSKDGSLTLYVQHRPPRHSWQRANWLPSPYGAFHLILRLYQPRASLFDGRYQIPGLVRH